MKKSVGHAQVIIVPYSRRPSDLGVESLAHLDAADGDGHGAVQVVDGHQGRVLGPQVDRVAQRHQRQRPLPPPVRLAPTYSVKMDTVI